MKKIKMFVIFCIIIMICIGCSKEQNENSSSIEEDTSSLEKMQEYMKDKSVGVVTGTLYEITAEKYFDNSSVKQYNSESDMIAALKAHKVNSVIYNLFAAKEMTKNNPDIYMSNVSLATLDCGFALSLKNDKLKNEINETLTNMKKSGKYDELVEKWINGNKDDWSMPSEKLSGKNGVIKVATTSGSVPFSMVVDGKQMGFDLEILYWVAYEHGYSMEIITMDFSGLIPAIVSGKADVAASTIAITKERAKQVLFTAPYIQNGHNVMFLRDTSDSSGFIDSIKESFDRNFIKEDRWKMILSGIEVTLIISIASTILGSLVGFGICMLRRSKNRVLSVIARIYIRILQGTPILVILMIFYYIVFGKVDANSIIIAIIAFSLNFGAYASEIIRSGIEAVNIGQTEAAYAMGAGKVMTFFRIIFPQAMNNFLPVYRGEIISLVKSTSIVGYIAIQDLTKMSDIIRSRTYEAFFPLISTAIIYFVISNLLLLLFNIIEIKVRPMRYVKGDVKE